MEFYQSGFGPEAGARADAFHAVDGLCRVRVLQFKLLSSAGQISLSSDICLCSDFRNRPAAICRNRETNARGDRHNRNVDVVRERLRHFLFIAGSFRSYAAVR